MTDREEFEAWMMREPERNEDGDYDDDDTQMCWNVWQACAAIKQRRIDELEAQLHMARFGAGGNAQHDPAGGRGFSGTRMSLAEPIVAVYGGGGWITQDANGPIPPEPQEPKP